MNAFQGRRSHARRLRCRQARFGVRSRLETRRSALSRSIGAARRVDHGLIMNAPRDRRSRASVALILCLLIVGAGAMLVLPAGAAASGRRATPASRHHPAAAVRILAPKAGATLRTPATVAVRLRIWTRRPATLRMSLNKKLVPVDTKSVRISRSGNSFIWSGRLTRVRLVSGANTLTPSIRNRRGVRKSATVTFKFKGSGLLGGAIPDLDVNGKTMIDGSLQLSNPDNPSLSCRVGGESSVREVDVDAGAAEVDHRDQGVG